MPTAPMTRWLPLGLAAGLAAGAAAYGQQKYNLRPTARPGDVCIVDSSTDTSLMLTVNVAGSDQGDQQLPFSSRHRESYQEKVLAVDEHGPTAVRRSYTIARTVTTDPYLRETTSVSSLQGKAITLRRTGHRVTVTMERGKISLADEKELAREFDYHEKEFFPDHAVAPGDEWPIDPILLRSVFPEADHAEARYHFQEVVPFRGHPCARIHITAQVQAPTPGVDAPMTIQLSGDMYLATDFKHTIEDEESGPISVSGSKAVNGVTTRFSGQGTLRVKDTYRWLTVDGHPVAGGR